MPADPKVTEWTPDSLDRLLADVMASDPPELVADLDASVQRINEGSAAYAEQLKLADLIDDLYSWLVNITGTPDSPVLDEARFVMRQYKTRHHKAGA